MKTNFWHFVAILLFITFYHPTFAQIQPACKDMLNAGLTVDLIEATLLSLPDCEGSNAYECYQVYKRLGQAEDQLNRAFTEATLGGCTNCDLSHLQSIATDINFLFSD